LGGFLDGEDPRVQVFYNYRRDGFGGISHRVFVKLGKGAAVGSRVFSGGVVPGLLFQVEKINVRGKIFRENIGQILKGYGRAVPFLRRGRGWV
jgi:hypothetical protein